MAIILSMNLITKIAVDDESLSLWTEGVIIGAFEHRLIYLAISNKFPVYCCSFPNVIKIGNI
jgi:hypothetical protein